MWDDMYVSMEQERSAQYKYSTSTTSSSSGNSNNKKGLLELPIHQELSVIQKHNKAIFDRINSLLVEFHQQRHGTLGSSSLSSRALASLMTVNTVNMKEYLKKQLLEEQLQVVDVLIGKQQDDGDVVFGIYKCIM